MISHRARLLRTAAVCAAAVVALLTGCAAEPEPTPTPTALFASDEEAFAAAEETYRAYVDATNDANAGGNPVPGPSDYLIGEALDDYLQSLGRATESNTSTRGEISVAAIVPVERTDGVVNVLACVDVSDIRVLDADGSDITPEDRQNRVELKIELISLGASLAISKSEASALC